MQIVAGHPPECLPVVRELFREYADATGLDLCFQKFDQELAELPGRYAPPAGRLFLAMPGNQAAGCVALRKWEAGVCELKRLYVRSQFRGQGLGRQLAEAVINSAREIGYLRLRLDTLASMTAAIRLYESFGFQRIAPYYENPISDAVYLELVLH
jgi:putative acetyltransferase